MEVVLEAIENTNRLADMVEEFPLDESYKYPHLWADSEGTFLRKIEEGIVRRGVDKYPNYQEYRDRIEEELKAYRHNGAIDFMLLMEDILNWCRTQDIQVGYGRGSVNGSVIAWLLGITEMDSIKHNLNFERFMNIERVSLSDIDTDFPPSRIEEVKDYIFSKTGLYCSDIITFNTIADKGAIRDVGRALEIPLDEVDEICKAFESNEERLRKKYPELFKYVDLVKGVIVSVGSHPCGLCVSPESLTEHMATFTTSTSKYPISQIYMKEIDGLNYVKLDLLRLDTIELINDTCKLAGIPRLTPDNVDINDVAVWNSMRDDSTGIFQWESDTGADYIKKLLSDENIKKFQVVDEHVDRMTLLTIGNSAIRPAGASYRDDLANGVVRKSGSQAIDDFLKPTFGYLVFQCQIIEFLHQYCGFTMGEADIVRRCVDEYTEILMGDGTRKKIRDILPGEMVLSYCGEMGAPLVPRRVNKVYDNGIQIAYFIRTDSQKELLATAEHKILTARGWIRCGDLTISDRIVARDESGPLRLDSDEEWVVSEKVDGTSCTYAVNRPKKNKDKFEFIVCSRNVRQADRNQECYHESNIYWELADKYNIEEKLTKLAFAGGYDRVVLQGEGVGNVQGNPYKLKESDLYVFNLIIDGNLSLGLFKEKTYMSLLFLHTLLVILCAANVIANKNKVSKFLWSCSGLCWLILSIIEITEMM